MPLVLAPSPFSRRHLLWIGPTVFCVHYYFMEAPHLLRDCQAPRSHTTLRITLWLLGNYRPVKIVNSLLYDCLLTNVSRQLEADGCVLEW